MSPCRDRDQSQGLPPAAEQRQRDAACAPVRGVVLFDNSTYTINKQAATSRRHPRRHADDEP